MKKYFVFLLFNLPFCALLSQNDFSGKVTDVHNTPLEFANVLLFNASDSSFLKGAVADEIGLFVFQNIETGKYYLLTSMLGYEEHSTSIFEVANEDFELPFIILKENSEVLEEVNVVAKKPLFEQKIDRTVVNVQNSVTATGSSALEILERSPGIDVDKLNNQIAMQGKQGVVVMLNGKTTRMEAAGLILLLQNMPSDNIEKIELISAPPASFDAEGGAGIINIQTIKKENEGINANLMLNAGYGIKPKFGGSLNLNFRKNRFNLFANLSGNQNYSQEDVNISRKNTFGNQITTTDIFSSRPATIGLLNGRLGMDFQVSERTAMEVLFSGYLSYWTLNAQTETNIQDNIFGNEFSELQADETNDWSHWMTNLNVRHSLENGGKLSFDFDYLEYLDINPTSYREELFNEVGMLVDEKQFVSNKKTPIDFQVVKLDYSKKWSAHFAMEMGLKGTLSAFTNDVSVAFLENEDWIFEPAFTDIYTLDEKIGAAYLSTDYKINEKINTKIGLRYEYYDSNLGSEQEGNLVVQSFGRLFPSFFLTYQMDEKNQIQFSYNERISRPAFNDIAPAFFFWNANTILAGNPGVKPTISRRVSTVIRHKALMLSLQFSDADNPITYQPTVIAEENRIISRAENMADAKTAMLALNFPIQIKDWWESRYNLAAYCIRLQPVFEGKTITRKSCFFSANMAQNFSLPKEFGLELTANLRSPRKYGLAEVPLRASLNIGLQKSFNENCKITLNWNDLFDLGTFGEIKYDQPDLNILFDQHYEMEGNVFKLSFSWQFGNTKLKKSSDRQTGSVEERRRVN